MMQYVIELGDDASRSVTVMTLSPKCPTHVTANSTLR
jgi:hypothetical protein